MFDLLSLNTLQKLTRFLVMLVGLNVLLISTCVLILSKFQVTPSEVQADVLINRGIMLETSKKLDRILERINANAETDDPK